MALSVLPHRQGQQGENFACDAWLRHRRTQQQIDETTQHAITIGDDATDQRHAAIVDHGDVVFRLGTEIETHRQLHVERLLLAPTLAPRLGDACGITILPGFTYHAPTLRSEEHTSELQSLMRTSYAVF